MELDDFKTVTGNGISKSDGELNIRKRVEECLYYLRDKRKTYKNYGALALDFGINGTRKFFPLPLFVALVSEDSRFMPYLEEFKGFWLPN